MTEDKGIKLLVKRLQSGNTKDILFTIKQIRNSGEPQVLPYLFDLMINNPDKEVYTEIIELINELKNKECVKEIVSGIENIKYIQIRKELIISCWYSGLDYSDYLALFVGIFIESDFLIAFECFTLIESFEKEYEVNLIDGLIKELKNTNTNNSDEKRNLLVELVHLLESKKIID